MYDFSYSLQDFPWTRVPIDSYGPESWRMPGEGWFTFVPDAWQACVYACLLEVDTLLWQADLYTQFVMYRVEFEAGHVQVWYGFATCKDGDRKALSGTDSAYIEPYDIYASLPVGERVKMQECMHDIDNAFLNLQYLTSRIPAHLPTRQELIHARYVRENMNMHTSILQ